MANLWSRTAPVRAFFGGFCIGLTIYCIGRAWVTWQWTLPHEWRDIERFATLFLFVGTGAMVTVGHYLEGGGNATSK